MKGSKVSSRRRWPNLGLVRWVTRIGLITAAILVSTSVTAQEPKELRDARRQFQSLNHASQAERVAYITRSVRLRESFTRADYKKMEAIDAEVTRHPMPAGVDSAELRKRMIGHWTSPRHS